jgi:hypothetical protein
MSVIGIYRGVRDAVRHRKVLREVFENYRDLQKIAGQLQHSRDNAIEIDEDTALNLIEAGMPVASEEEMARENRSHDLGVELEMNNAANESLMTSMLHWWYRL